MAKQDKNGVASFDDTKITMDEKGKETYETVGGMSDLAIDAVNTAEKKADNDLRAFRYTPSQVTGQILSRSEDATGMSKQDIITIALIVFQNATQVEINSVITSLMSDKSQALFNSLK